MECSSSGLTRRREQLVLAGALLTLSSCCKDIGLIRIQTTAQRDKADHTDGSRILKFATDSAKSC